MRNLLLDDISLQSINQEQIKVIDEMTMIGLSFTSVLYRMVLWV